MKLNLKNNVDALKAETYLQALISKEKIIELKELRTTRSISQNSYMHVVISIYAIEFGYTLEEAKTLLKRMCGFMQYEKSGDKFLKQTSKMDTKELTEFIEWIRNHASKNGLYIPSSEEYITNRFEIDKDINNNKQYL